MEGRPEEVWGIKAFEKLKRVVGRGDIDLLKLEKIAEDSRVNAKNTFIRSKSDRRSEVSILEKILEHWYNTRLYNYEMDEAQNLLLDVLKESRIDPIFITRIEDSLSKSTRL